MLKFLFLLCIIFGIQTQLHSAENSIVIHYQNRPPFFIDNSKTKKLDDGIAFKLIDKILKNSQIKFSYENQPLIRTLLNIKENTIPVCFPFAYKSSDREKFALFSKPYYKTLKLVIPVKENDNRFQNISNLEQLISNKNLKPILKIGYNHEHDVAKLLEKYKNYTIYKKENEINSDIVLSSKNQEEMLIQLINNEGDYIILTLDEYNYYKDKNPFIKKNTKFIELNDQKNVIRHFMCSKQVGKNVIDKLNLAIDNLNKH
ncbi:transporter substrate-binding domain-containing protein [Pigmentibacter sp. JX0631]|uniref:transporter substrate-binding domain-containing protein n=1 Tax=Pigmentibacter sp. JX0631 TaxID=2976982 RepID=UPI002469AFE0|nr:transporter substrate-binding domain-containing protein [Pigmentibacter sp. JX0631]WGL59273.1 transporter substrate-binding domain-containing protein [Pigmentibacter sp. JX0631]